MTALPLRARALRLTALLAALAAAGLASKPAHAGEPDPASYWKVDALKPGMKGTGRTVMVGTKLEEFGAEVLGVMKGVSPGRDMVLCRLTGCNLEHAGIIQGMSGSPIYIDGKLLGAVAFAWEFAKDPIAGVTPFEQMVAYARSSDRKAAAEAASRGGPAGLKDVSLRPDDPSAILAGGPGIPAAPAGMRAIAMPVAATGFGPRAMSVLEGALKPWNMAPIAGGAATPEIIKAEGDKPLVPGAPLSIAMVTGDFDLSGIGTVTHVEGDRVFGFGHPMLSLGACEFPMMTGYIHTVYPRASVSMKMGSPLKVVGVLDTDVSTGVAGRLGKTPDMIPMSVKVKSGRWSDPATYRVEIVREPNLLAQLVMAVLTNAIDTEGNLPEELTARLKAEIRLKGRDPIRFEDTLSGPRYTGMMGPSALFGPVGTIVNLVTRNPHERIRIEGIDCEIAIDPGRSVATIESIRLASDRVEPGQTLRADVTFKPYKGDRETIAVEVPIPADYPEGAQELVLCDLSNSVRRRFRNQPSLTEPRDLDRLLQVIKIQATARHDQLFVHLPLPDRGLDVDGQTLPSLPSSARAVFGTTRKTSDVPVRADQLTVRDLPWVIEGTASQRFNVVKDRNLSLK